MQNSDIGNKASVERRSRRNSSPSKSEDVTIAFSQYSAESIFHTGALPPEHEILLSFRGSNHRGIKNIIIRRVKNVYHYKVFEFINHQQSFHE